jgi:hypothetical protein
MITDAAPVLALAPTVSAAIDLGVTRHTATARVVVTLACTAVELIVTFGTSRC